MITKQEAVGFEYRKELWSKNWKNADGTPIRCRVNGKCKTWVTRPDDFRLPVKRGLRQCFYIDQDTAGEWYDPEQARKELAELRAASVKCSTCGELDCCECEQ